MTTSRDKGMDKDLGDDDIVGEMVEIVIGKCEHIQKLVKLKLQNHHSTYCTEIIDPYFLSNSLSAIDEI